MSSLVHTDHFAWALALLGTSQAFPRNQVNGISARLWHLVNLPAGTDIRRSRVQIGALDREVRRLTVQLEHQRPHHHAEKRTTPTTTYPPR
jgi:hypothetical protein